MIHRDAINVDAQLHLNIYVHRRVARDLDRLRDIDRLTLIGTRTHKGTGA